jgi:hypothetical protein
MTRRNSPGLPWLLCSLLALLLASPAQAEDGPGPNLVTTQKDDQGWKLHLDGQDFMVLGMNWGYMPIGENYSYDFWGKDEAWIKEALDREMALLSQMGVNTIRQYDVIPPRWVQYIAETWGIYSVINHTTGRYGFNIDGAWVPHINYSDPHTREVIKADVMASVERYKDTPGVLMWLLGNENNYGLEWTSFEIQALPVGERQLAKARHLYSLWGELIDDIHAVDSNHPVAIANGDLQYIDLIAELCPNLDVMGSNVYRGISARDLFEVVRDKLDVPFVFTEFGADAFNARTGREDHLAQAYYLHGQWREIYEQSHGKGLVGNSIGGITFQWSDGWWKYMQEINLDIHDTNASWPNGGYPHDFVDGQNNMNEEWWGICAKTPPDETGMYEVQPRAAYYVLQAAYELDPYDPDTTVESIREHFEQIRPAQYKGQYDTARAVSMVQQLSRSVVAGVRGELSNFLTSGSAAEGRGRQRLVFDHTQSFWLDVGFKPSQTFDAELSLNLLGNVAQNPIDELFYERRGRPVDVVGADGENVTIKGIERLKIYNASFRWDAPWFRIEGYYRNGHTHWGYEGDFFGLYREAYYGPNLDIYDGEAPFGAEITGKRFLEGLKVAVGPQIYWGANPTVVAKYQRKLGPVDFAIMHQEDITSQNSINSTIALPEQLTRKSTVYLSMPVLNFTLEAGGILAGTDKIGDEYVTVRAAKDGEESFGDSGWHVLRDRIWFPDALGAKAKLRWQKGQYHLYAQGSYRGIVADGGPDQTMTFTGWTLKEDGRGNHWNVLGGAAMYLGNFQVAPQFLYQKPLEPPLPRIPDVFDGGVYLPGARPRNIFEDPFTVLGNRETIGAELILAWDPTPATWMWQWDANEREDAPFAASLDFVYRVQPTVTDSYMAFLESGQVVPFGAGRDAQDEWDLSLRMLSKPAANTRIVANLYTGQRLPNSPDTRLITRYGADLTLHHGRLAVQAVAKVNDWGPYDYHRDFNLTFPLQLLADASLAVLRPRLWDFWARAGVRAKLRYLDENSPRFVRDPAAPDSWGNEWEIMGYVVFGL